MKFGAILGLVVTTFFSSITLKAQESKKLTYCPNLILGVIPAQHFDYLNNPIAIFEMPFYNKDNYFEVRYNYDQINTGSIYWGPVFRIDKEKLKYSFIPQIGIHTGAYNGLSLQFYYKLEHKKFEIDFENQYSVSAWRENFYFNWSTAQYNITSKWFAGLSTQLYNSPVNQSYDFGYLAGYQTDKLNIGLYHFNPYRPSTQYFYLIVQYKIGENDQ